MIKEYSEVAIENIGGGVMSELFQREVKRVVDNICDVNTEWKPKREIVIKISFSPSDERNKAAITVRCASKLAPVKPKDSTIFLARRGAEIKAFEHDLHQAELELGQIPKPALAVSEVKHA